MEGRRSSSALCVLPWAVFGLKSWLVLVDLDALVDARKSNSRRASRRQRVGRGVQLLRICSLQALRVGQCSNSPQLLHKLCRAIATLADLVRPGQHVFHSRRLRRLIHGPQPVHKLLLLVDYHPLNVQIVPSLFVTK